MLASGTALCRRLAAGKERLNRLGSLRHHEPQPLLLPRRYERTTVPPSPPTISIVTPSLNRAAFLPATIASVTDQGYPALEYFVADGGSQDGTRELLAEREGVLSGWVSEPDRGQAHALNRGFARTSGEIMAYLNADDLLLPGSLAYVACRFAADPGLDVVYGHRVLLDAGGREIGRHVIPRHRDGVLSWADFVPQETLFWRRTAWEAAGGEIDESFAGAMDWDLLLRLRDSGARMARLPRFLGAFRVHPGSKTLAEGASVGVAEMDRIRRRVHGRPVSQAEALRAVRPYLLEHVALDRLYRAGLLRY